ncbi:rRNA pseudouridine synthase [Candidatus Woesearchaeota archaeon]|nr:rRNA pseudouridine synthase [Candidatus Woesearchaeota archaeon]
MHRVQKLLSNYGYCSRRNAEELIKQGRVKVNNKLISIGDKASENDKIYVDDRLVKKEKKLYFMFNKPVGCVTALTDRKYKTVMEYIDVKERIFPIGRLDYFTSGLLLFTNDGDFSNNIIHPRYEIKKTYMVGLYDSIDSKKILMIEKGVMLEDGLSSPAKVRKLRRDLVEVTIHEGKNRILRRIFKELGLRIKFLKRIRIGMLNLGDLTEGKYRKISKKEIEKIFDYN